MVVDLKQIEFGFQTVGTINTEKIKYLEGVFFDVASQIKRYIIGKIISEDGQSTNIEEISDNGEFDLIETSRYQTFDEKLLTKELLSYKFVLSNEIIYKQIRDLLGSFEIIEENIQTAVGSIGEHLSITGDIITKTQKQIIGPLNLVSDYMEGIVKNTNIFNQQIGQIINEITSINFVDFDILFETLLEKEIEKLFSSNQDESFENGYESRLSNNIREIVHEYAEQAVSVIGKVINEERFNENIISQVLIELSRLDDEKTHTSRLEILLNGLKSKSKFIRDSSGIGISFLNDKRAVSDLQKAIEIEKIPELKEDLLLVLEYLEK